MISIYVRRKKTKSCILGWFFVRVDIQHLRWWLRPFYKVKLSETNRETQRVYNQKFCISNLKDPPPWMAKKHLLVQSHVERTAFSDQNYFFLIEYISNLLHMYAFFLLLYQMLYKLKYLNLQFNYNTRIHRANFLSFSGKKGDTKHFL